MSFSFSQLRENNVFLRKYRAISFKNTRFSKYENSGKIVLSDPDLDALDGMRIRHPYLFSLSFRQYQTCVGVIEFNGEPGYVYIPDWIFKKLRVSDDCMITIKSIVVPRASSIVFKPNTYKFEDCLANSGALARILPHYSVAMKGDYFRINFNNKNYILQIVDVKPSAICDITEGDVAYTYVPADDTPKKPAPNPSETTSKYGLQVESEEEEEEEEESDRPMSRFQKPSYFATHKGAGHRLGESTTAAPSPAKSLYTTVNAPTTFMQKKSVGVFEQEQKKSLFQGTGHKLGR